jgi:hypothetical protein
MMIRSLASRGSGLNASSSREPAAGLESASTFVLFFLVDMPVVDQWHESKLQSKWQIVRGKRGKGGKGGKRGRQAREEGRQER